MRTHIIYIFFLCTLFLSIGCEKNGLSVDEDGPVSTRIKRAVLTSYGETYSYVEVTEYSYDVLGRISHITNEVPDGKNSYKLPSITNIDFSYGDDGIYISQIKSTEYDSSRDTAYYSCSINDDGYLAYMEDGDGRWASWDYAGNTVVGKFNGKYKFVWSGGNLVEMKCEEDDGTISTTVFEYYEDENPFYNEQLDGAVLETGNWFAGTEWAWGLCGVHNRNLLKSLDCESLGQHQKWMYCLDEYGRIKSFVRTVAGSDCYVMEFEY